MTAQSKPQPQKIAIVGGGLAGCLTLHALMDLNQRLESQQKAIFQITLFEKNSSLCGLHTWSFHENDLPHNQRTWLMPLVSCYWPCYQVYFPMFEKQLNSGYLSIRSHDLADKTNALSQFENVQIKFNADVQILSPQQLKQGSTSEILNFDYILDCRGWKTQTNSSPLDGYQKFIGLEVELETEHNLTNPIVMDARVSQIDGYRFVYVLPMGPQNLLVEDTYYSNQPQLDDETIIKRITEYADQQNWKIKKIHYQEKGCLLIPAYISETSEDNSQAISLGVQGNQYQAVTGYSTPYILQDLEFLTLMLEQNQSAQNIKSALQFKRKKSWKKNKFYFLLNRMLFGAAEPEKRYLVLQRFYTFDEKLIQRFYAGKTSFLDMVRILSGRPPVSVRRALGVLFKK